MLLTSICTYSADIDSISVRFAAESPALISEKARIDAEYQNALNENILEGPEAEFEYKFGRRKPLGRRHRTRFRLAGYLYRAQVGKRNT